MNHRRRNHYDVTDRVRISHPGDVCEAVSDLLSSLYPGHDLQPLHEAFATFTPLYAGTLPGYVGCDTWYHDAQHSLDCALATARLVDGHDRSVASAERLGARRGVLGVIISLFHDAGYIRRTGDPARNGAEYTLNHVHRSGEFLAEFLPRIGYADEVEVTRQIVHFTGYEIALDKIRVADPKDRMLGFLIGTADVLAQTADRCYLEKCRDFLFREFEICGLAGPAKPGQPAPRYATIEDLLVTTPEFNQSLWEERLDGYFKGAHRYMERHFGGGNPYVEQIREHIALVERLARHKDFGELSKRPRAIGAKELRRLVGIDGGRSSAKPGASSLAHAA